MPSDCSSTVTATVAAASARLAVADAGLEDRVFFNDVWVPYDERAAWLQDATCAVARSTFTA